MVLVVDYTLIFLWVFFLQILGHQSVSPLDADDCYVIGVMSMRMAHYGQAVRWFTTAIKRVEKHGEKPDITIVELYSHLSEARYHVR